VRALWRRASSTSPVGPLASGLNPVFAASYRAVGRAAVGGSETPNRASSALSSSPTRGRIRTRRRSRRVRPPGGHSAPEKSASFEAPAIAWITPRTSSRSCR
jgi:hypothetical protein